MIFTRSILPARYFAEEALLGSHSFSSCLSDRFAQRLHTKNASPRRLRYRITSPGTDSSRARRTVRRSARRQMQRATWLQDAAGWPPGLRVTVQLKRLAGDVPLATILHPDDPATRSKQIKRGQRAKGNRGGRPVSGDQRQWLDAILRLWRTLPYERGTRVSRGEPITEGV